MRYRGARASNLYLNITLAELEHFFSIGTLKCMPVVVQKLDIIASGSWRLLAKQMPSTALLGLYINGGVHLFSLEYQF